MRADHRYEMTWASFRTKPEPPRSHWYALPLREAYFWAAVVIVALLLSVQ